MDGYTYHFNFWWIGLNCMMMGKKSTYYVNTYKKQIGKIFKPNKLGKYLEEKKMWWVSCIMWNFVKHIIPFFFLVSVSICYKHKIISNKLFSG